MGKASRKKTKAGLYACQSTLHNAADSTEIQSKTLLTYFASARWLHLLIILIAGLVIYSVGFSANFIWDDHHIVRSPAVHNFSYVFKHKDTPAMNENFISYFLRPVGLLSFVLNYKIHGFEVMGYHIFNTIVHILTAFLVYSFVILTLKTDIFSGGRLSSNRYIIAFLTSLLFVVHPIQTQAVAYISQRFTSLCTFFYMLSLVFYIRFRLTCKENDKAFISREAILYYVGAIVAAIVAYKTKEIAYTIPFTCLLYEVIFFKGRFKKRAFMLLPIFLTLVVFPLTLFLVSKYSIVDAGSKYTSLRATGIHQDMPRLHYFFTELVVLVRYLGLMLLPINQSIYHDYVIYRSFFDLPVLLSFAFFAIPIGFSIRGMLKNPENLYYRLIAFGVLWYLITLSIESSVIPLYPIYEHRLYLPSVALFFSVVTLIVYFLSRSEPISGKTPTAALIIIILSISAYAVAGYNRSKVFSNDRMLWEDVKAKKTTNIPHSLIMNIGLAYMREGRYEEALTEFNRIAPYRTDTYNSIGVIYLKMKRYDDAISAYKKALSVNPDMPEALIGIGEAYLRTGRVVEAIESLQAGRKSMYPHFMIYNLLGSAYIKNNQPEEAIKAFEKAVRLKPDFVEGYIQMGVIYKNQKMFGKAFKSFSKALSLRPGDPDAERHLSEIIDKIDKEEFIK